jgi:hypothetical protein
LSLENKTTADPFGSAVEIGAGEETRTLDNHLGKVALYQLSYARVEEVRSK